VNPRINSGFGQEKNALQNESMNTVDKNTTFINKGFTSLNKNSFSIQIKIDSRTTTEVTALALSFD
jgi:hypothetical protein